MYKNFFDEEQQRHEEEQKIQLAEQIDREREEDDRRLEELAQELEEKREQERRDEDEHLARLDQELEEERELQEKLEQERLEQEELDKKLEAERIEEDEREEEFRNQKENDEMQAAEKAQEERSEQERIKAAMKLEQEQLARYTQKESTKAVNGFKQYVTDNSALRFARRPRTQQLQENRGKQLEWHIRYQNSIQKQDLENWKSRDPENREEYFQARMDQINLEQKEQLEHEIEPVDLDTILDEYDNEIAAPPKEDSIIAGASREFSSNILKDSREDSLLERLGDAVSDVSKQGQVSPDSSFDSTKYNEHVHSTYEKLSYSDPRIDDYMDFHAYLTLEPVIEKLKISGMQSIGTDARYFRNEAHLHKQNQDFDSFLEKITDPELREAAIERMQEASRDPYFHNNKTLKEAHANEPDLEMKTVLETVDKFAAEMSITKERLADTMEDAEYGDYESDYSRDQTSASIAEIFDEHKHDEVYSLALKERYAHMLDKLEKDLAEYKARFNTDREQEQARESQEISDGNAKSNFNERSMSDVDELNKVDSRAKEHDLDNGKQSEHSLSADHFERTSIDSSTARQDANEARELEDTPAFNEVDHEREVYAKQFELQQRADAYIEANNVHSQEKDDLTGFIDSIDDPELKKAALERLTELNRDPESLDNIRNRLPAERDSQTHERQDNDNQNYRDLKQVLDKVDDFAIRIADADNNKFRSKLMLAEARRDRDASIDRLSTYVESHRDDKEIHAELVSAQNEILKNIDERSETFEMQLEDIATREEESYRLENIETSLEHDKEDVVPESASFEMTEDAEAEDVLETIETIVKTENHELSQEMKNVKGLDKQSFAQVLDRLAEENWHEHWLEDDPGSELEIKIDGEDRVLDLFGLNETERTHSVEHKVEPEKPISFEPETKSPGRSDDDCFGR